MALTYVNQVGAPKGLNQAAPGSFIPEDFVRWAQDVLFDRVGQLRRRAPFEVFTTYSSSFPTFAKFLSTPNERVLSVVSTLNPNGNRMTGLVVSTSAASRFVVYNDNFQQTGEATLDLLTPNSVFDCKQSSNGGMWLSFLDSYKPATGSNKYYQYFWYGGAGTEQSVSSVTLGTSGSGANMTYTNAITGTFDAATITPGMFVYVSYGGNDYYVGMIKAVSASTLTLEKDIIRFKQVASGDLSTASPSATTGLTIKVKNVRPYIRNHARGLINYDYATSSTTVTSGAVGTEGEGHFKSANIGAGWALYRASDYEWIGDVDSITNNTTLVLSSYNAGTAFKLAADEYVAYKYAAVPTTIISNADSDKFAGIFNATYAGLQWFGNGGSSIEQNRIVFSAYHNSEGVDLSIGSADSIVIPGTAEMRGLASSSAGLLVFTADKTYILRGNYRANFSLEELYPEGCLSSMSIVEYGGGVFWTSRIGILYYDGATVRNLTEDNFGSYFTDSVKTFNVNSDRIYAFLHKDHLFVHFTAFDSVFKPSRYEPVYAENIDNTPAIADFDADDWDKDFSADDFLVENNVPVYWDYVTLYESTAANSTRLTGYWSPGDSFVGAATTSGSSTLTLNLPTFSGSANVSTDAITSTAHGLVNGTILRFTSLSTVTGLTTNTVNYYVINATANTFQVSTSVGGSAVNLTGTGATVSGRVYSSLIVNGAYVVGPGIPANTTISATSGNSVTMSANATATATITAQILSSASAYTWGSVGSQLVWGPTRVSDGVTFAIYLPTNAATSLSNFDFRGAVKLDAVSGIKALMGVNVINPSFNVKRKQISGTTATLTLEAAVIPAGASITVSDMGAPYDGTWTITSNTGTTVTYTLPVSYTVADSIATGTVTISGVYPRLIDVDSVLDTDNTQNASEDAFLLENEGKTADTYIKGPDFYIQTKHFTVGDPILKKWFRQVMLNLYLLDGGLRMDVVDMEDNDRIDVQKKRHKNWELFGEAGYSWNDWSTIIAPKLLSPNRSEWSRIEALNTTWYEITDAEFTRRKKPLSWRYPSMGFRLYQMNKYRPRNYQEAQRPNTVIVDSWNIGFKPLRQSRV